MGYVERCAGELGRWNRETIGQVGAEVRKVEQKLRHQFNALSRRETLGQIREWRKREEILWWQWTHSDYLKYGDANTRQFHNRANMISAKNSIDCLKWQPEGGRKVERTAEQRLQAEFTGRAPATAAVRRKRVEGREVMHTGHLRADLSIDIEVGRGSRQTVALDGGMRRPQAPMSVGRCQRTGKRRGGERCRVENRAKQGVSVGVERETAKGGCSGGRRRYEYAGDVSDLIDHHNVCWYESLVRDIFLTYDADCILSIPLCGAWPDDKLIWHYHTYDIFFC
ncbi:hypothetical protein Cgig2_030855 [Carnegiea gigantea]|uniref:Uncharacterized protein n=1 Tax=Carnegiea gigantea TaxID=171969 RepID=A0A9Q1KHZ4_9CARY|nr:hypothetical protein Cgig2_030855 [Carnegiea gigantea]